MTTVKIIPVTTRRHRKAFIDFPYRLHRDNGVWVPPLRMDMAHLINPKKNAFFEHGEMQLFLARSEGGETLGRIGAIINGMHLKKYRDSIGFFGFFECVDDRAVSDALFVEVESWLAKKGMKGIRGPVNPSLNDTAGLLVNGFNRQPAILMVYNPPYYEQLVLGAGYERAMTMWSYYTHTRLVNDERLFRGMDIVLKRNPGLTIRTIDMGKFKEEARCLMDIYNDAWSENWGHVPMTEKEFDQLAGEMKQIVDPNLITIVEDRGEPVAFSASIPDMNYAFAKIRNGRLLPFGIVKLLVMMSMNVIHEIRMPLMGVKKSHQGRGLDALIVADVAIRARKIGILGCEMSWVLDNNVRLRRFLEQMGAAKENEYALYERSIG